MVIVCCLALTLTTISLFVADDGADAMTLQVFEPALSNKNVDLTDAGNDFANIRLPKDTTVFSASLKVTGETEPTSGDNPSDIRINIGDDADDEWGYGSGNGWGQWGHQNMFKDGMTAKQFNLYDGKQTASIRIPAEAQIESATFKVDGKFDAVPTKTPITDTGFDNIQDVKFGDLDGDGDEDIIGCTYASNGGEIFWYENQGISTWIYHNIGSDIYVTDIIVADLNKDSDLDIAFTQYTGSGGVYWYDNNNSDATVWVKNTINASVRYMRGLSLGDLDGDGNVDAVANSGWGDVGTWFFLGPDDPCNPTQEWTTRRINGTVGALIATDIGFIDSDAREDIVVSSTSSNGDHVGIWAYQNPTNLLVDEWTAVRIDQFHTRVYDLECADITGDLQDDVFAVGDAANSVFWLKSSATPFDGKVWDMHNITFAHTDPDVIQLGDVDGDADIDVLVTAPYNHEVAIYWQPDVGLETALAWTGDIVVDTSIYITPYASMADLGPDGDMDIVISGIQNGEIIVQENVSAGNWNTHIVNDGGLVTPTAIATGDIDDDGDEDIVACTGQAYSIYWFERPADPSGTWNKHLVRYLGSYTWGVEVFDVDGDNDLDIVTTDYYGREVDWFENDGTPASGPWAQYEIEDVRPTYPKDIFATDIDGMNGLDLIVQEYYWSGLRDLLWYESPVDPTTSGNWPVYTINSTLTNTFHIDVADIDGDGKDDVIVPSYNASWGEVRWYQQPADPKTEWPGYVLDQSLDEPRDVVTFDVDFDSDIDIICSDYRDDRIYWYENPGDPVGDHDNWTKHLLDSSIARPTNLEVEDVGDDNVVDLVVQCQFAPATYWLRSPDIPTMVWNVENLDMGISQPYEAIFANISGDEFDDLVMDSFSTPGLFYYHTVPQFPQDLSIDIGDNGVTNFIISNPIDSEIQLADFTEHVETSIADETVFKDSFGNDYVEVPIAVWGSGGNISIYDIEIRYNLTVTLEGNDIVDEIGDYLHKNLGQPYDELLVPINVTSASGGRVRFWDLSLNYNDPPTQTMDIPDTLRFDEDSIDAALLDLALYFNDTHTPPSGLTYRVLDNTNSEHVNFTVYSGYSLQGDSTINPDWYGTSDVRVIVSDPYGLSVVSNTFTVTIDPVNDKPRPTSTDLPTVTINEAGSKDLDLDAGGYFTDVEGDEMFYSAKVYPSNIYIEENITLTVDNTTKVLNITAADDYSATGIVLRVFCDDENPVDEGLNIYKTLILNVNNVVDDMVFSMLPSVTMDEDSSVEDIMDLDDYVSDPDNPTAGYTFSVVSVDDPEVTVGIDSDHMVDVTAAGDFFGTTNATISVRSSVDTRPELTQTMVINVNGVNDAPIATLTSPASASTVDSTSVNLSWSGTDIEGDGLTYDVYLDGADASTKVASAVSGTTYTATGLVDGLTYKWRVIPTDGVDEGTCESGTWTFTIDTSLAQRYKVEVSIAKLSLSMKPGDSEHTIVIFKNTGLETITVTPSISVSSGFRGTNAFKPVTSEFTLNPGDEKQLELIVTLEDDCPSGTYIVTVNAAVKESTVSGSKDLEIKVSDSSGTDVMAFVAIAVIVIILLIIAAVVMFFVIRKAKQDSDMEEDDEQEDDGSLEAEIAYEPGSGKIDRTGMDLPVLDADIVDDTSDMPPDLDTGSEAIEPEIVTDDGADVEMPVTEDVDLEFTPPDLDTVDEVPELEPVEETPAEPVAAAPSKKAEDKYAFKKKDRIQSSPKGSRTSRDKSLKEKGKKKGSKKKSKEVEEILDIDDV